MLASTAGHRPPPGIVPCRVVPTPGEAGSENAECPAPASIPNVPETSPRDDIPSKRKMVVPLAGRKPQARGPWQGGADVLTATVGGAPARHGGAGEWRVRPQRHLAVT